MDKATFADPENPWWLSELVIADRMVEPRKDLSSALGYSRDDEFYKEKWKLEAFYDLLEKADRNLLTELDAIDDDYKREEWLASVLSALRPEEEAPAASEAATAGAAAAAAAAVPAAPAAKKPAGIFGKKAEEEPAPAMAAADAVKVVMGGLDDARITELASKLQISADEIRELLSKLPADFEAKVAQEAATIAAQAS